MQETAQDKTETTTYERDHLIRLVIEAVHRIVVHYGLWWKEVEHQLGRDECIAVERAAWDRWFPLQMTRLGKVLGFEVEDGVPKALLGKSDDELRSLLEGLSANWLAQDGLWFQSAESRYDLTTAQRANDTAWSRFSPFEVASIKSILNLPDNGGLDALEQAMHYRLYAFINQYTIERPDAGTLILRMNDCRVQSARKRRGLADYPCKSGGTVEYVTFARAIDPRIVTRCIGCPPDPHPDEWYCAWEFTLPR